MTTTKRDRLLLAIIGVLAVVGGVWWFVVKPAHADASAARAQLAALEEQSSASRDMIARLSRPRASLGAQTREGFRLTKAIPVHDDVPGAIVQMQRIADRSSVRLAGIRTHASTDYGPFRSTELEVVVTGRFFDVDDFMFRLHRLVRVDDADRPRVTGRLMALQAFELELADADPGAGSTADRRRRDVVEVTLHLLVFSAAPGGGAAGAATTAAGTTTTGAGATAAPGQIASTSGAPGATASRGGTP